MKLSDIVQCVKHGTRESMEQMESDLTNLVTEALEDLFDTVAVTQDDKGYIFIYLLNVITVQMIIQIYEYN